MQPTIFFVLLCIAASSALNSVAVLNSTSNGENLVVNDFLKSLDTTVDELLTDIWTVVGGTAGFFQTVVNIETFFSSSCSNVAQVYQVAGSAMTLGESVSLIYIPIIGYCAGGIPSSCDNSGYCQNVIQFLESTLLYFYEGSEMSTIDTNYFIVVVQNSYAIYSNENIPFGISL